MSEPIAGPVQAAAAHEHAPWFTCGVRSIGLAGFLADSGHDELMTKGEARKPSRRRSRVQAPSLPPLFLLRCSLHVTAGGPAGTA